jgi:hypothetical protein
MTKLAVMLISATIFAVTLTQAEGASSRNHARHPHQQSSAGYASSPLDMGTGAEHRSAEFGPAHPVYKAAAMEFWKGCSIPAYRTAVRFQAAPEESGLRSERSAQRTAPRERPPGSSYDPSWFRHRAATDRRPCAAAHHIEEPRATRLVIG